MGIFQNAPPTASGAGKPLDPDARERAPILGAGIPAAGCPAKQNGRRLRNGRQRPLVCIETPREGRRLRIPDPPSWRHRSADRLLAGDCHEPDLGPGGSEQPAAEGLAFEAPQPEGQRRDHLQTIQLHAVNDPQRAAPAQCLRAVDRPDIGPHGRLEDPEQPGYFQLREPHLAPGRAADRDLLPVDRNRPRENALHRRRHYRSAGRAFISRRMVWSSTLA